MSYAQARLWDEPEHPREPTPIRPRRKPVRKIQPTIRNIPGLTATMLVGDVLAVLPTLPDESVHTVVTSPPYYGLRDYGTALWDGGDAGCSHTPTDEELFRATMVRSTLNTATDYTSKTQQSAAIARMTKSPCPRCGAIRVDSQLGLEATPEQYVEKMVAVFREVRRVLRKDGTLWLNIGDSYAGSGKGPSNSLQAEASQMSKQTTNNGSLHSVKQGFVPSGMKHKDLMGIPWMLAFALRADGWYLRSDIIWSKPNPMPESVSDRPTKAHEYLFLLTKSARYFYDQDPIREPHAEAQYVTAPEAKIPHTVTEREQGVTRWTPAVRQYNPAGRNKRSVWQIATAPFPKAHFATFPPKLVEPCIRAGTSEKGCCPECGAPWGRVVEREGLPRDRAINGGGELPGRVGNGRSGLSGTSGKEFHVFKATYPDTTTGWRPSCKHAEFETVMCEPCDGTGDVESVSDEGDDEWNDCMACKGKGTVTRFVSAPDPVPCTVLDPFAGAATTLMVAAREGRNSIGIELSEAYAEMARERLREDKLSNVEVQ